jgi:hypothetical protein
MAASMNQPSFRSEAWSGVGGGMRKGSRVRRRGLERGMARETPWGVGVRGRGGRKSSMPGERGQRARVEPRVVGRADGGRVERGGGRKPAGEGLRRRRGERVRPPTPPPPPHPPPPPTPPPPPPPPPPPTSGVWGNIASGERGLAVREGFVPTGEAPGWRSFAPDGGADCSRPTHIGPGWARFVPRTLSRRFPDGLRSSRAVSQVFPEARPVFPVAHSVLPGGFVPAVFPRGPAGVSARSISAFPFRQQISPFAQAGNSGSLPGTSSEARARLRFSQRNCSNGLSEGPVSQHMKLPVLSAQVSPVCPRIRWVFLPRCRGGRFFAARPVGNRARLHAAPNGRHDGVRDEPGVFRWPRGKRSRPALRE